MGNISRCDLRVTGNKRDCEKVIELLKEVSMYNEIRLYKLSDGFVGTIIIENGLNRILLNEKEKINLFNLSKTCDLLFELFCENRDDETYEYCLVNNEDVTYKKQEYHHFLCLEHLETFLEDNEEFKLEDFEKIGSEYYFGRMEIEFTI